VDSSHGATLAQIWAYATRLGKFVEERAERLCREATPPRKARRVPKWRGLEMMAEAMEYDRNLIAARVKAKTATINDLIAGQIVGLGRPSDSYNFERIDRSFWVGAAVDWDRDAVIRDGTQIIDVRIVLPYALPVAQPKQQLNPETSARIEVIRAAIREYATTDPDLSQPRSRRYRTYRSYISSQGFNVKKRGFSDKTFEKYELEFRRKSK
jgi:hypothetical protein